GAIWLRGGNVSVQGGTVIATGGAGGDAIASQSSNGGDGGAGSTGRIRIDSPASIAGTTNPTFTQGGSTGLGISLHAFELTQPTPGRVFLTNKSGAPAKVRLVVTF
ncbi:MAG: hypothetical protein KC502_01140, partial [Myxococcales bacterium]|nr:hypothetical protein [Myxococcales bacterium]